MISTGLQKLDEFIGGGLPAGKSLLFEIEPGMEETDIGFHVMKANIDKANIIYISSISSPRNVYKKLEEFGVLAPKNFSVIDGYSSLIGAPSDEKYVVEEPHDIRSYEDIVLQAVYESGENTLVVFDSLSNIMDLCNEREALDGIERINSEAGKIGASMVYNFISWPYKESILYKIKRTFNGIIEARKEGALSVMEIKKIDWNNNSTGKKFYFGIFKPEGLRVYIPKIIVAGSPQSGKTSFIKAISKKFSSVERLGTTAGVEYGVVDYKDYRAELFGLPGREEFMPLLEKLAGSSMGIIIVVDSTSMASIEEAKKLIARFKNMPCVVIANKQDMPGAKKKEEIRSMLQIDDIVEGNMVMGQGAYEAFLMLAEKVVEWLNDS